MQRNLVRIAALTAILLQGLALTGCMAIRDYPKPHPASPSLGVSPAEACLDGEAEGVPGQHTNNHVARELEMVTWAEYEIGPEDVLSVSVANVVPRSPYTMQVGDVVFLITEGTFAGEPLRGQFQVNAGGAIQLGPTYGSVRIAGLTFDEARDAIIAQLTKTINEPRVQFGLIDISGRQEVDGEHTVGPDGTITLGRYGSVRVVGMNTEEAAKAVQKHLSGWLNDPQVAVRVAIPQSKEYYVVVQNPIQGDRVIPLTSIGNERVLDAIARAQDVTANPSLLAASSKKIWVARPNPYDGCPQILPVAWQDVYKYGIADTNYQLFPGDRVFVAQDPLAAFESILGRVTAPFDRSMSFGSLGVQAVQAVNRFPFGLQFGTVPQ